MKEIPLNKTKWLATAGVVVALALTGCSSNPSTAAAPGATSDSANGKVAIMVGGLNKQIYLPFMLAQQLGYYKEQGLTVTLSDEPAGVDATTNMLAGQVDGVGGFYDHTIDLAGLGQQVESVVNMLTTPGEVELCRTDLKGKIKSPADWSGRTSGSPIWVRRRTSSPSTSRRRTASTRRPSTGRESNPARR